MPFISPGCRDASRRASAGHGTGSYFTAARLNPGRFWRYAGCGYACINMCVFMSWRRCVRDQIHQPTPHRRIRWPVTSKGLGAPETPASPPASPPRGKSCLWRRFSWRLKLRPRTAANGCSQEKPRLRLQPGSRSDRCHPGVGGRFKSRLHF